MGNGGTRQKPKKAGQAQSALPSGRQPQQLADGDLGTGEVIGGVGGAPGGERQEREITFEVDKLSPIVYQSAKVEDAIEVQKQNMHLVVLLHGRSLGEVPSEWEDALSFRSHYSGKVHRINRSPQAVSVRVRI
jgi:hypothetical protein